MTTSAPDHNPAPSAGEKKMQLSIPVQMHDFITISGKIPFRGGNEFARQCLAAGQELHARGLVQGTRVDMEKLCAALDAAGHKAQQPAPAPPAPRGKAAKQVPGAAKAPKSRKAR